VDAVGDDWGVRRRTNEEMGTSDSDSVLSPPLRGRGGRVAFMLTSRRVFGRIRGDADEALPGASRSVTSAGASGKLHLRCCMVGVAPR